MFMKCTKFDKHACKDFLWILLVLLARLKWTHRHTHTCTAAMLHQLRSKLREGIISAVLFKVGKLFSLSCIILVFRLHWIEKKCWHSGTNTNYARVRHLAFTWTSLRVISFAKVSIEGHSMYWKVNLHTHPWWMIMNNFCPSVVCI